MMVSQALDTLTSMSATARLQQANKLHYALIINIDVNKYSHVSVKVLLPPQWMKDHFLMFYSVIIALLHFYVMIAGGK